MDALTILTSVASSLGISVAGAWWLSQTLISHRLTQTLENHKSQLARELESEKAALAGAIKERVDTLLADRAAEREYAWEARKRLYQLIGPLRFQLLLACRDAAKRVEGHGLSAAYDMSVNAYYGINTLYRILRPISISELIEQHVAYADFSVDESAIGLLRFKKSVATALTGSALVRGHPRVDWTQQVEHLYYASLSEAAHALIVQEPSGLKRVAEYHEFAAGLESMLENNQGLAALARIVNDFAAHSKPLFWLRLVTFAYVCREHVGASGASLGFEYKRLEVKRLLKVCKDEYVVDRLDAYESEIERAVLPHL